MAIPEQRSSEGIAHHPGEMLQENFLPDYKLTVLGFAKAIGVLRQTVNEVLREGGPSVQKWCFDCPGCLATPPSFV